MAHYGALIPIGPTSSGHGIRIYQRDAPRPLHPMKFTPRRARLLGALLLLAPLAIGAVRGDPVEPGDYGSCTAEQYARLRTEGEIAATIGACTRVVEARSATVEQRARAHYFRALNHFLDAVRLAVAEMKPLGSAGEIVQRRIQAALDDLAACIEAAPTHDAAPFSLRATIHTTLDRYDAALADLGQAIRIDPKTSSYYVQRALIHERTDRFQEARADLDAAVSLDPKNQNAWINRARLWTRYGDIDRAFSDYDRAVAAGGPQQWDALSGRGKLAVRLGDPKRAFADWTRAAGLAPLPNLAAQLHVRAGNLARDYLKDPDGADLAYRRAFAAFPNYPDALIQQGIAWERAGRFEEASNVYGKAIELTRGILLERAVHDYARYRLDVLRSRLSRKASDPPLPPNVNVLSRAAGELPRDRGKRVALVIGNAAYAQVSPLMNADRDAESVGGALGDAGFARVTVATNLDRRQLLTLLQQFSAEAADADWALVYYAGHGIEVEGRNFLIPVDAHFAAAGDVATQAVAIDEIMGAVRPAKQLRLVALDACRDNPFVQEAQRVAASKADGQRAGEPARAVAAPGKEIGGGFAGLQIAEPNTIVLYSTQPGRVALDGDELNSPFTRAFLRNIPVPGLDLRLFLERVGEDVAGATERRQRPAVNGRLRESARFAFFPT